MVGRVRGKRGERHRAHRKPLGVGVYAEVDGFAGIRGGRHHGALPRLGERDALVRADVGAVACGDGEHHHGAQLPCEPLHVALCQIVGLYVHMDADYALRPVHLRAGGARPIERVVHARVPRQGGVGRDVGDPIVAFARGDVEPAGVNHFEGGEHIMPHESCGGVLRRHLLPRRWRGGRCGHRGCDRRECHGQCGAADVAQTPVHGVVPRSCGDFLLVTMRRCRARLGRRRSPRCAYGVSWLRLPRIPYT